MQALEYNDQLRHIENSYTLIVDDNKINQLVTQKVLDQVGIKSSVADSGIEAIEIVKTKASTAF